LIARMVVGAQKPSLDLTKTVAFIHNFVNGCFFKVETAIGIICGKV